MAERARTMLELIRSWMRSLTGQKPPASGVIIHDPASQRPHDLDDPFFDQKVQTRIAEAITNAAQKK